jgi:hypothetical protein
MITDCALQPSERPQPSRRSMGEGAIRGTLENAGDGQVGWGDDRYPRCRSR